MGRSGSPARGRFTPVGPIPGWPAPVTMGASRAGRGARGRVHLGAWTRRRVDTTALAIVAATVFLWGAGSARLGRADVTGPMVFVSVGLSLIGTGLVSGGC